MNDGLPQHTDSARSAEPDGCTLRDVRALCEELWPAETAEPWDRVGLVTGDDDAPVRRILLAVDAVAATVDEALGLGADLLLTHHPLLLRGVTTIAEDTGKGAMLARLIRGRCALFAAHTNADAPAGGVSAVLAGRLGLEDAVPILPGASEQEGTGRVGDLASPVPLAEFAQRVAAILPPTVSGVRVAGDRDRRIARVAVLGGAGDSLLDHPLVRGADVYVTSDLRHHPAQESLELSAAAGGPALIDVAHWAAESLWLDDAAHTLSSRLGVEVGVSRRNTDPWTFSVGAADGSAAKV